MDTGQKIIKFDAEFVEKCMAAAVFEMHEKLLAGIEGLVSEGKINKEDADVAAVGIAEKAAEFYVYLITLRKRQLGIKTMDVDAEHEPGRIPKENLN